MAMTFATDINTNDYTIKLNKISAPTTSGGSTYGVGTSGQVLKSNGTSVYWAADNSGGTITGITMNGASKGTSGVVDLGYVYNAFSLSTGTVPNNTCVHTVGYLESEPNKITVGTVPKYSTVSISAAAGSWSSATPPTQTVNTTGVTASNLITVCPASNITADELDALAEAKIICTGQASGSITLTCYGTEPSINIPLLVTIWG